MLGKFPQAVIEVALRHGLASNCVRPYEARAKFDEQRKAMRASRDAANKKLHEMRAASESAWQHMQAGVDWAWASRWD